MTLLIPMRVRDSIIARCRSEIESPQKRLARGILLPFLTTYLGISAGEGFQWGLPLSFSSRRVAVGRYVYIGQFWSSASDVVIGDLTMVSTNVSVFGDDHLAHIVGGPTRLEFSEINALTIIESDCWIGTGAMLKAGITIGRGSVVAAGSVVTRSVAPYEIVAGVPARVFRRRFTDSEILLHDEALYDEATWKSLS